MLHLIALAKFSDKEFAYHYATSDVDDLFEKKEELANIPEQFASLYSIHVLKTASKSFESIQVMDPYFKFTTEIESLDEFIDKLQDNSKLTSIDVASYIEQKYHLGVFLLQKILYYVYSDLLIKLKVSPFTANFVAYDRGPVDIESYKAYKYSNKLDVDAEFDQKLYILSDSNEYLRSIESMVETYSKLLSGAWDNEEKNLTHNPGTPWSRAHSKGYNVPISDKDIIKYHYLETV